MRQPSGSQDEFIGRRHNRREPCECISHGQKCSSILTNQRQSDLREGFSRKAWVDGYKATVPGFAAMTMQKRKFFGLEMLFSSG
jgi:hypothetical protein